MASNSGYIYCISDANSPNDYIIYYSIRDNLRQILDTYNIGYEYPKPYNFEIVKKVLYPEIRIQYILQLVDNFKVITLEYVKMIFELIDGEYINDLRIRYYIELGRELKPDEFIVRHVKCSDTNNIWYGIIRKNCFEIIQTNGNKYTNPSLFATIHNQKICDNGWNECETTIDGENWIKLINIRY